VSPNCPRGPRIFFNFKNFSVVTFIRNRRCLRRERCTHRCASARGGLISALSGFVCARTCGASREKSSALQSRCAVARIDSAACQPRITQRMHATNGCACIATQGQVSRARRTAPGSDVESALGLASASTRANERTREGGRVCVDRVQCHS
jgi:hypothetical protein